MVWSLINLGASRLPNKENINRKMRKWEYWEKKKLRFFVDLFAWLVIGPIKDKKNEFSAAAIAILGHLISLISLNIWSNISSFSTSSNIFDLFEFLKQYKLLFHFIHTSHVVTNILTPWWTSMDFFLRFPTNLEILKYCLCFFFAHFYHILVFVLLQLLCGFVITWVKHGLGKYNIAIWNASVSFK